MKKILILLTTVLLAALAACDDERDTGTSHGTAPLNHINITRAPGTDWVTIEDGSSFYLYVKDATGTEKLVDYTYNSGAWTAQSGSDEIICGTGSYPAYAYGWINVTYAGTHAIDELWVTWVGPLNTTLTAGAVTADDLEMNIATTRIKVSIIGAYGEADADLPNFWIESSAKKIRSFDYPADPYTQLHIALPSDNPCAWFYRTNAGYSPSNIAPQTIAAGTTLFTITGPASSPVYGTNEYTVVAPADITLKAGKEHHYTIRLNGGGQAEIVAQDITDFVPGGNSEIIINPGIKTEADLRQLSADWAIDPNVALAKWEDAPGSRIIRLLADIEMKDPEPFTPIANTFLFIGVFDGQGHTITGLQVDITSNAGLFGQVSDKGTVRNLILRGAEIKGGAYTGGITGINKGIISACSFGGTVEGNSYAGGIAGYNNGTIAGCYSMATSVTATNRDDIATTPVDGKKAGCISYSEGTQLDPILVQDMNNALSTLTPVPDYSWVLVNGTDPVLVNAPPVYADVN